FLISRPPGPTLFPYTTLFRSLKAEGALRSIPIIVLRHARATSRENWTGPDATRPLTGRGQRQAKGIVEVLRAFGVERIISSDALDRKSTRLNSSHVKISYAVF